LCRKPAGAQRGPTDCELAEPAEAGPCANPVSCGQPSDRSHIGLGINLSTCKSQSRLIGSHGIVPTGTPTTPPRCRTPTGRHPSAAHPAKPPITPTPPLMRSSRSTGRRLCWRSRHKLTPEAAADGSRAGSVFMEMASPSTEPPYCDFPTGCPLPISIRPVYGDASVMMGYGALLLRIPRR
jgi:hypothetical protein